MNPFGLPDYRLNAFARPVLEYLPAGYDADDAAQAEIDDVGSLAALASPDIVAARISRLGVDVSTANMTERLLDDSQERTVVAGLRYRNLDPAFPFVAVKTTARMTALRLLKHWPRKWLRRTAAPGCVASRSGSSRASTFPPQRSGQRPWPDASARRQEQLTGGT